MFKKFYHVGDLFKDIYKKVLKEKTLKKLLEVLPRKRFVRKCPNRDKI